VLINIVVTIILIRHLTIYLFGVWSIFLIVSAILRVTLIGIIQKPTIKFLIDADDRSEYEATQSAIFIMGALFCALCAAGIGGYYLIPRDVFDTGYLSTVLVYFIPQLPFWLIYFCIQYSEQAHYKYYGTVVSAISFNLLFLLGVLYLIGSTDKLVLPDILIVQLLALVISTIIIVVVNRKYIPSQFIFDKLQLSRIFGFTRYVAFANLIFMFKKNLDTFILNIIYGPNAVAIYQTAIKFLQFFELPNQVVSQASFPKSVKMSKRNQTESLKAIFESTVGKVIKLSIIPVAVLFAGADYIIELIGGFMYSDAATHLRILLAMAFIYPVIYQFGTILDSQGQSRRNYHFAVLHLLLIIVLMPLIIYTIGPFGASIGLVVCHLLILILYLVYLKKTIGIEISKVIKNIFSFGI